MNKELIEFFKDGLTIDKLPNGKYSIFTPSTKRFTINNLEELTPEHFTKILNELVEKRRIEEETIARLRKEKEEELARWTSIENLTYEFFKSILDLPPLTEIPVMGGKTAKVGYKYLMKFNNGQEYEVYIHTAEQKSKTRPDLNEIGFIIANTGRLEYFTIEQLKKNIKELSLRFS